MSVLDRARKTLAKVKAHAPGAPVPDTQTYERNELSTSARPRGVNEPRSAEPRTYEINEFNEESPLVLVTGAVGLQAVLGALADNDVVGVDTETTGLDPRADRIRLLSLAVDTIEGPLVYLVDCFAVDPTPLFAALAGATLVM